MTGPGHPRPVRLVAILVGSGLLVSADAALSRPKIGEAFFAETRARSAHGSTTFPETEPRRTPQS